MPHNQRLHGARATVAVLTDWGAHVSTGAAATGGYRAGHNEMVPLVGANGRASPEPTFAATGDVCSECGGGNMRRAGACLVCADCGSSGGCG